jgi:parallel beta-helix repeat protein
MNRKLAVALTLTLLIGTLNVAFNVQKAKASGTIYIRADGSIDPLGSPISTVDNVTYTFTGNISDSIVVERSNIIVDGSGYTVQGSGDEYGFSLTGMINVTIKNMSIRNFDYAIRLSSSNFSIINGNNITDNGFGIYLFGSSSNNTVSGNNITANGNCGILINWDSSDNTVSGNNITANDLYGIGLYDSSGNNTIYHNNFINNANLAFVAAGYANVWDDGYPSGGNYWSNYAGVDSNSGPYQNETGSDGISDTSFGIFIDNIDNYPLMRPWMPFEGQAIYIRADGNVDPSGAPLQRKGDSYTLTSNITSNSDGIVIERDNITIDGNERTLEGDGNISRIGFKLHSLDNVTIRNTNINRFGIGVSIYGNAANNTVSGNNITDCDSGIYVSFDPRILINPNWFLLVPRYNNISVNFLANNNRSIHIWEAPNTTIYRNNIVNSNMSGIYLVDPSNTTIAGNNVTSSYYGIYIWLGVNNTVYENTIANGTHGLYLYTVNSALRNNRMVNNKYDFGSPGAVNDIDTSNTVNGKPIYYWINKQDMVVPLDAGHVTLINCTRITVQNLNLNNNSHGVLLFSTTNSTVTHNNITSNYWGILLESSSNNSVVGNNIEDNDYVGIGLGSSSWNSVFQNNFINNKNQTVTSGITMGNTWDNGYPSGGNYWNDYSGSDLYSGSYQNETACDGIGDTDYVVDASNIDHYPLMGKFSDFNATAELHVNPISNSTITDFQFDGTAIRFNVTGEEGTAGFCRICVPKELMSEPYHVFINGTEILPPPQPLPCSNSTHNYLYFNYTHSTQEVIIIPEYPSFLVMPLFMMVTLLAAIVSKKKRINHRSL